MRPGRRHATDQSEPVLHPEVAWAGGGLNLYIYLQLRNLDHQHAWLQRRRLLQCGLPSRPGRVHLRRRQGSRASTNTPWWLDVENVRARTGRATPRERRSTSRERSTPSTRQRASPTSASTPARVSGTPSSATTSRACPIGWPTTWRHPADRARATTTPTGSTTTGSCRATGDRPVQQLDLRRGYAWYVIVRAVTRLRSAESRHAGAHGPG